MHFRLLRLTLARGLAALADALDAMGDPAGPAHHDEAAAIRAELGTPPDR